MATRPRVEESRRRVEERLRSVNAAVDRELGIASQAIAWSIPLVGFAVGLALAKRVRRRRADDD